MKEALELWRSHVHLCKTWRHQTRLASSRARQCLVGRQFRHWDTRVSSERRMLGEQARLRRKFMRRLLHSVFYHLHCHVKEARTEEKLCRAYETRGTNGLSRSIKMWKSEHEQQKFDKIKVARTRKKIRRKLMGIAFSKWGVLAHEVWRLLRKLRSASRRVALEGAVMTWKMSVAEIHRFRGKMERCRQAGRRMIMFRWRRDMWLALASWHAAAKQQT